MNYMILIHSNEKEFAALPAEQMKQGMAAYLAYSEALVAAGAMVGGERLHPTAETATVSVRNGKTQVLNGPYSDSQEQIGGYYVIKAKNMDEALQWAAKCPGAHMGSVEVRPIWTM